MFGCRARVNSTLLHRTFDSAVVTDTLGFGGPEVDGHDSDTHVMTRQSARKFRVLSCGFELAAIF